MRLDSNAFRLIKPVDSIDDYNSGNFLNGGSSMSNVKVGAIHKKDIIKLINKNVCMSNKQIAKSLNLTASTVSNITRKMVSNGDLEKGQPIVKRGSKPTFTFYVAG